MTVPFLIGVGVECGTGVDLDLVIDHVGGDPVDVGCLYTGNKNGVISHRDLQIGVLGPFDLGGNEGGTETCGAYTEIVFLAKNVCEALFYVMRKKT